VGVDPKINQTFNITEVPLTPRSWPDEAEWCRTAWQLEWAQCQQQWPATDVRAGNSRRRSAGR